MRVSVAYTASHALAAGLRRLRVWLATRFHRATLAKVGYGCVFHAQVGFHPPVNVRFGNNCFVARGAAASTEVASGHLRVGNNVHINRDVHLDMTGGLTIGDNVLISEKAVLYTHDH
uniref:acyltransferase n=1 Tax=Yoonia sp. TaxID=2212373 RepID=UPI0035C7F4BF